MARHAADPPSGWVALDGVLRPGVRVCDYGARGQAVIGKCQVEDCKRTVRLEPAQLAKLGIDGLTMDSAKRLWSCQKINYCGLAWHNAPPDRPLVLAHCMGKSYVRIRVRCRGSGCKFYRVWTVEEIVHGLRKRDAGDERTEVYGLGEKMTAPCPVCKKSNWACDVLWIDTDTVGWKQMGEKFFDVEARKPMRDL